MRSTPFLVAALAFLCATPFSVHAATDTPSPQREEKDPLKQKTDQEKLEGTWIATGGESGGMKFGAADLGELKLTFKGKLVRWEQAGSDAVESTHVLAPGKNPRQIDLGNKAPVGKKPPPGLSGIGIYKIEGDRLTLHVAMPGGARPQDFITRQVMQTTIYVLKRQDKPARER